VPQAHKTNKSESQNLLPMQRLGRVGKEWLKTRREWVRLNPPNHQGYYTCYLCGKWVPEKAMELDHVISRSRAPELRFSLNNLQASCAPCNRRKGSR
jgi:5-methylcytosine-specific restriction endonuclease McrA